MYAKVFVKVECHLFSVLFRSTIFYCGLFCLATSSLSVGFFWCTLLNWSEIDGFKFQHLQQRATLFLLRILMISALS